jgi:hypothetical protein
MPLNPELEKQVEAIYSNTKRMPVLTILGFIFPVLLIFAGPLGLLDWFRRNRILADYDAGNIVLHPNSIEKLDHIRESKYSLLVPIWILGAWILFLVVFIASLHLTHSK